MSLVRRAANRTSMSSTRRFAAALLTLLSSLLPASAADAPKPLLWRIEGVKPSYIFGTIHLANATVTKLAPVTQKAVDECDALYCEVPMDMASQMKAAGVLMGGGEPLSKVLPKDVYEMAEAEVKRINPALSLQPFENMKIWALSVMIPLIEEQMKNPGAMPLDALLYNRAEKAGKQVGGLETIEEQVGAFEQFSLAEQIDMLRAELVDLEKARKEGKKPMAELQDAYMSGDLNELEKAVNEWTGGLDPKLLSRVMEAIFYKRNTSMAERIAAKIRTEPAKSYFFAFGAGHLGGEKGVIKTLEKQGLKVTRVVP